jgi:hypothetical protein
LEGAEGHATFSASKHDELQLREYSRPSSHDAADSDKAVEVRLTELAKGIMNREIRYANMDLIVDAFVIRIMEEGHFHCCPVEYLENLRWNVHEEVRKNSFGAGEMVV